MRLLLDESLPRQLARHLEGHETQTVQKQGWAGLKNGVLLRAAAAEFDVFVTGDQNLQFQQNFAGLSLAVIVLVAFNNRLATLLPLVPEILRVLQGIQPGQVLKVPSQ